MTEETVIAEIWAAEAAKAACRRAIFHSVSIERERDVTQDARFGVRQLADIALRALSPAVNDPTTAVLCIQYLQAVFERFVCCQPQPSIFHFANGASILEIRQPTFQEYLEVFLEIGHYAGGNTRVISALLTALKNIMEVAAPLSIQEYQDLLTEITSTLASKSMMGFSLLFKRSGEARRRFTFPDRIGVAIVSLIMLVFLASFMYECVSILHASFMVWLVVVAIISFAVVTINILLNLPEHVP